MKEVKGRLVWRGQGAVGRHGHSARTLTPVTKNEVLTS